MALPLLSVDNWSASRTIAVRRWPPHCKKTACSRATEPLH